MKNKKLGFIGQGFVGKNLADNFEERGYKNIVRYALEKPYCDNKDKIKKCDIVFVAVPTPTTLLGIDITALYKVMPLTKKHSIVVIKSTLLPENLERLQRKFKDRYIMHCPEFLTESTAKYDTGNPIKNIIGVRDPMSKTLRKKAEEVLMLLPFASQTLICGYTEATLIKYGRNCFFYMKNVFFNMLYDLVRAYGGNWKQVQEMLVNDPWIHPIHTQIPHKGGRGAGGRCLPKDFTAFRMMYGDMYGQGEKKVDLNAHAMLLAAEKFNKSLLESSSKDLDIIKGIYENYDHE